MPAHAYNSNNYNNNNNNNNNNDTDHREWKIMLRMHIKCISTKSFIETRTMHPKSRQVEVYMGSDTENVIDKLLNEFIADIVKLLEYELHKINIIRA